MGDETYGELGNGAGGVTMNGFLPNVLTNMPVLILSYTAPAVGSFVTAISAGGTHSLLLKSDGSLWAMGDDDDGQLGDGISPPYFGALATNRPEQIRASGVAAISAGGSHSMFLDSASNLWVLGDDEAGQLGDGSTNSIDRPEMIVETNVIAISAGFQQSLFLKSDGTLWGMGDNTFGELGLGFDSYYGVASPEMIFTNAPPPLGISIYGGRPAVFFATDAAANFVLQMTTNLASPNWVTVTNGIPISGVQITNAPGTAFFRLH